MTTPIERVFRGSKSKEEATGHWPPKRKPDSSKEQLDEILATLETLLERFEKLEADVREIKSILGFADRRKRI